MLAVQQDEEVQDVPGLGSGSGGRLGGNESLHFVAKTMAKTNKRTRTASFSQRLVALISEPEFIRFEHILGEPNIFRIVGRTHYERWHSCFLGWLLDPGGSHLLMDYTLIRFLLLLTDEKCLKPKGTSSQNLLNMLPTMEFNDVEVTPNEYAPSETSIQGVGRFDVFLTASYQNSLGSSGKLNVIFELKIDSKPNGEQSKKYADWLLSNHPNDTNFLIYLLPKLASTSEETVGDNRWYCMNYQLLNDKLLLPLLDHPSLNDKVKPFIVQYLKNLKIRYRGIKMAITNDEKRMAVALYEKYSDVFDSIYDALVAEGMIDYSTADTQEPKGRSTGRIAVRVDGKAFSNENLRLLFSDVLKYLVDKGHVTKIPLPWGSTKHRYIITNEDPPVHPNGRNFFYPVKYKGYSLESHYARDRGLQVLKDLCEKLEIDFEPIET